MPDLAYDGEAWALVELRFDECAEDPDEKMLLSALVSGEDLDGNGVGDGPVDLCLPRLPAAAFRTVNEDETVQEEEERERQFLHFVLKRQF